MKELDLALEVKIRGHILATSCLFGFEYAPDAICPFCNSPIAKITLKEVYSINDTDNDTEVGIESKTGKNVIKEVETRLQSFNGKCPHCSSSPHNTPMWIVDSDEEKPDEEQLPLSLTVEVDSEHYEVCYETDSISVLQDCPDCGHKKTGIKLRNVESINNIDKMMDIDPFSEEGKSVITETERIINGIETTCMYCLKNKDN